MHTLVSLSGTRGPHVYLLRRHRRSARLRAAAHKRGRDADGGGANADDRPGIPIPAAKPGGTGGQGGGTAGDRATSPTAAGANKGGGSGGTRASNTSGAGGKGIVILRY